MKTYECHNPACTLGNLHQPGRFTGGITIRQRALITAEPFDETDSTVDEPLEGACPNCGVKGKVARG